MLAGSMRHQDHVGNQGELVAGSVQWMTAGCGIIHSEMPRQQPGLMSGCPDGPGGPGGDSPAPGHNAFAYVYEGEVRLGPDAEGGAQKVAAGQLAVVGDGERLTVASADAPARFLLLAAQPLREPIARHGLFVMNTREEIVQAVEDYQRGTLLG